MLSLFLFWFVAAAEHSPVNDNNNQQERTTTPIEQRQSSPSDPSNELTELKPVVSNLPAYSQPYAPATGT